MATNYIISVHGRGASYCFMATCEESEVASKCTPALRSGFECYIYTIEPSPLGQPGFTPIGSMNLRRVWHLYDAHDQFKQEAQDIITRLDMHSVDASKEYLAEAINILQTELEKLCQEEKPKTDT